MDRFSGGAIAEKAPETCTFTDLYRLSPEAPKAGPSPDRSYT
jgi:hypothetical protein